MFGDDNLYFISKATIDSKRRLSIPSKTGVEVEDELTFVDKEDFTSIYNAIYFDKILDKFENERMNHLIELRLKEAEEIEEKMKYYNSFLLEKIKVDSQRRILIPDHIIEKFGYSNSIVLYGEVTHVNVFKDEEQLNDYKIKVRKKYEKKGLI